MKYSELERKLKKTGCYQDGEIDGHPAWFSPVTGQHFKMSHHKNKEITTGTLNSIKKSSGAKF